MGSVPGYAADDNLAYGKPQEYVPQTTKVVDEGEQDLPPPDITAHGPRKQTGSERNNRYPFNLG